MATESLQGWLRQAKHAVVGKPTPTSAVQRLKVLFDGDVITQKVNTYVHRVGNANPLNVILGLVALYIFVRLIKPNSIAKLTPTLAQARSSAFNANTSYSFLPDEHPPSTVWKKYTPRTLAVHDGSGTHAAASSSANTGKAKPSRRKVAHDAADNRILLAIDGRVFDVSRGANFYGPGGPYGNFAGRDASRGMAKQSFDLEMLTPLDKPIDTLSDLTPMEVNNMREWIGHFSGKYTIVGELVNEGEEGE